MRLVEYNPDLDLSTTDVGAEELIKDARRFLATLPKRQARVSYLYYTVGHTMVDIAEMDNISVKTVEKTLTIVNKKLRERYS